MKVNTDYTYCTAIRYVNWEKQCKKCKRNIELYDKPTVPLWWTDFLVGKRHLKRCPMYDKL